jgi:hypothetical protein
MTPRRLDRSRVRLAERIAPAGYRAVSETALYNSVEAGVRERDAVAASSYDAGYADGLEAGLRQVLADAELALGRAA